VEVGDAKLIQFLLDGIGEGGCGGFDAVRQGRRVTESGKVERDHVVLAAQHVLDRPPCDGGFSHPVQQHQRFAGSSAVTGRRGLGERLRTELDDLSSLRGSQASPLLCRATRLETGFPMWACAGSPHCRSDPHRAGGAANPGGGHVA
jgi:hypothetical protein